MAYKILYLKQMNFIIQGEKYFLNLQGFLAWLNNISLEKYGLKIRKTNLVVSFVSIPQHNFFKSKYFSPIYRIYPKI